MKKILLPFPFAILFFINANAQHAIRANRAANHIGEKMVVIDSIYAVNIYSDSTATIDLGKNGNQTAMKVLFNFKLDKDYLRMINHSVLEVTGVTRLILNQPAIIVNDKSDLYFFSQGVSQKLTALSQAPDKKMN
jgi:hypothetical protein